MADRDSDSDQTRTPSEDAPVLPDVTRDEIDPGWGDEPHERGEDESERSEEWYRRERPPHHE